MVKTKIKLKSVRAYKKWMNGRAPRAVYRFVRRHLRGVIAITVLYSLLFDYFQETLLIDGMSPTPDGPFQLKLPAGTWVITSTKPPIPSGMPFPLWGPFLSITTNYFDFATTPLSLALTLAVSFLFSVVIFAYIDLYRGVTVSTRNDINLTQVLSMVGIVVSCSCEFLEGLLGAVEPAVPSFASTASLLTLADIAFLTSALFLLSVSSVLLVSRLYGVKLFEKFKPEQLVAPLLVVPLVTYTLSRFFIVPGSGSPTYQEIWVVTASVAGGIVGHAISGRPRLFLYPILILTYVAIGGMPGLIVAVLLGVALGFISRTNRIDTIALPVFALVAGLLSYYLVISFAAMVTAGLFAPEVDRPGKVVALQAATWTPIMLGPLAVMFGPALPFPLVPQSSQVEAYLFLWLVFTPVTWYLGLKAIMAIVEKSGFDFLRSAEAEKQNRTFTSPGALTVLAGALAILSQYALFLSHPYLFLVGVPNEILPNMILDTASMTVVVVGIALIAYGLILILENSRNRLWSALLGIVRSRWTRGPLFAFGSYLLFSLASVGTFGFGGAPASMALPSATLFVTGPPLFVPAVTLYLTRDFGLVLVPEHVLVSLVTTYLFSLNIKALTLLNASRGIKGAAILGGLPAVALACPTCTAISTYFVAELLSVNLGLGLGILASPIFDGLFIFASWTGLSFSAAYIAKKITDRPSF